MITIDDPEPDNGQVAWLVALMSLLGVVMLCCGMMLGRYGWTCDAYSPRIQSMRADASRRSDEWTVLSSAELRSRDSTPSSTSNEPPTIVENPGGRNLGNTQADDDRGLRRRTRRSRNFTDSVPSDPRLYPNPSAGEDSDVRDMPGMRALSRNPIEPWVVADLAPEDPRIYPNPGSEGAQPEVESLEIRGSPQAQGSASIPEGPHIEADPAPYDPRYPVPRNPEMTLSAPVEQSSHLLGIERRGRGECRSSPSSSGLTSSLATSATTRPAAVAPSLDHNVEALVTSRPELSEAEEDLERDNRSLPQGATVMQAAHNDDAELELRHIVPGWTYRAPPRALWPTLGLEPSWGGSEGRFHQPIPLGYGTDFWYYDPRRNTLLRIHCKPRRLMFVPQGAGLPPEIVWERLSGRRRTYAQYQDPSLRVPFVEDRYDRPGSRRALARAWVGRTELEVLDL